MPSRSFHFVAAFLSLLMIAVFVLPGPAGAQYGGTATITVSTPTASPGDVITVRVTSCPGHAGETVPILIDGVRVGTGVYDENGSFTQQVTVPGTAQGNVSVTVPCGDDVLSTQLNVVVDDLPLDGGDTGGTSTGSDGTLPFTGSNSTGVLVQVAMGLIGIGALLLYAVPKRRRREQQASATAAH